MRQRGLSEDEAYQVLRKAAMDKGSRMAEVARQLIEVAGLFE
jgi:response regulator NasT